jgi:hypothetical protein
MNAKELTEFFIGKLDTATYGSFSPETVAKICRGERRASPLFLRDIVFS